jgi:hypothetical protein
MPKKPNEQVAAVSLNTWSSGRTIAMISGAIVLAIAAAYLGGVIGDDLLGVIIATVVGVAVASRVAVSLLDNAGSGVARVAIVLLALAMLGLAVMPVALTIMPGKPMATGALGQPGDTVSVPQGTTAPLRLLVHGSLSAEGAASVDFEISGAKDPIVGRIERSTSTARVGRRGTATQVHEHTSEYLEAVLPAAQHELELTRLDGPLAGALDVRVFRDWFPQSLDVIVGACLLAIIALLAARLHVGSDTVVLAGLGFAFGVVGHEFVTPDAVVRPLVGSLIVAALAGGSAGGILAWAARQVLPAPAKRA